MSAWDETSKLRPTGASTGDKLLRERLRLHGTADAAPRYVQGTLADWRALLGRTAAPAGEVTSEGD